MTGLIACHPTFVSNTLWLLCPHTPGRCHTRAWGARAVALERIFSSAAGRNNVEKSLGGAKLPSSALVQLSRDPVEG